MSAGRGLIRGKRIWDISCIPDREKTRMELTDLVRFKGHWYCGFREGTIHHDHPSGRARIIRSADGETWRSVALFEWDGGSARTPRLSITAEGHLMAATSVYFVSKGPRVDADVCGDDGEPLPPEIKARTDRPGCYYQLDAAGTPASDLEPNVARQSVSWLSSDGENWSTAYACPSGINAHRWSVTWHNGMGYSNSEGGKDSKGTLYRTRDGKSWRVLVSDFAPEGFNGSEGSLAFGVDDTAYCLFRGGARHALLGVGKAPYYQEWEWRNLSVDPGPEHGGTRPCEEVLQAPFGGPKLIRLADGRFLAAGRILWPWREDGRINLFWLDPDRAVLTRFAAFEGTSYPGVFEHEGMLWVTFTDSDASEILLAKIDVPD